MLAGLVENSCHTGFYMVKNIAVRNIDRRQWWSNGLTVRVSRGQGFSLTPAFRTSKGEDDVSTMVCALATVRFPGVYNFEGPS